MVELKTEGLRDYVRRFVEPYVKELIRLHGENIISIALYGSATGRFFLPGKSDINLVVVFRRLGLEELKKSLKLVNSGIRKKITAPLFLSASHIETSKDVYPVEFLEIKENNVLLYGEDIFSSIDIDLKYLRLFCERELKGKLIRIRQAYLEIGLKRKGIEALLKESLNSLLPIFRSLVRLKGEQPDTDRFEVFKQLERLYNGVDSNTFAAILKDRLNDEKIAGEEVEVFFERYIDQIKKLADIVDRL